MKNITKQHVNVNLKVGLIEHYRVLYCKFRLSLVFFFGGDKYKYFVSAHPQVFLTLDYDTIPLS